MADSSVARSDRDILELNVHVVFSFIASPSASFFAEKLDRGVFERTNLRGVCHDRLGQM
jgi:hypothetical protein